MPWRGGAGGKRRRIRGKGEAWEKEGVGGRGDRSIKMSYSAVIDVVSLQDATALGYMQGC